MKSSAQKVKLASIDDLFTTEETRQDAEREKVVEIALSELHPFPGHPFQVREDESMNETVESIKDYGVLSPAIVRPREDGGYEIVAGHRRKRACELAGLDTMPCLIRDMDRDIGIIAMVDSNIQRENILPSEKARAYKMKLDAIKRRAGRPSKETQENGGQVGHNFHGIKSRDLIAGNSEDSARTVQRYIRLTELKPELQQMVDENKMGLTPAVELSYLKPDEQDLLLETIESEQAVPSLSQAQRIRKLSQSGELNEDAMLGIMSERKKPETCKLTFTSETLHKYFPKTCTPKQMEETILKLLDQWLRKRQRSRER